MMSGKYQPHCLGLNMLSDQSFILEYNRRNGIHSVLLNDI